MRTSLDRLSPGSADARHPCSALSPRPLRSRAAIVGSVLAIGALAGCSLPAVGPDFRAPTTPAATTSKDPSDQLPASVDGRVASEWWREFGDADLDGYVALALKENQDLEGALARVEQARALTGQAHASYLPMIGATGLATREQTSETITYEASHSSQHR